MQVFFEVLGIEKHIIPLLSQLKSELSKLGTTVHQLFGDS